MKRHSFFRRIVRAVVGAGLCAGPIMLPAIAFAQPRLDRLEVAIWPEYDQPAALVILRGFVSADTPLPTTIPLPMPAAVDQPNAVAKRSPDGQGLLLAAYSVEARDRWKIFQIETDTREVRLEYYAPLDLSQSMRELIFDWPGGIAVGQMIYEVQQPAGATDLIVLPPPDETRPGSDGLTYAFADLGSLGPDQASTIVLSYNKASPALSIATLQPTFPAPAQQQAPAATEAATPSPATGGSSQWWVTVAIVIGVGLLVIWFVVSGRRD